MSAPGLALGSVCRVDVGDGLSEEALNVQNILLLIIVLIAVWRL